MNADDFGATQGLNRGIVEAHRRGIVTSTSLMVEAPAAADAARLGRETETLSVGLHFDLPESRSDVHADCTAPVERQAERFLQLMGRRPTHLDSHRNIHRAPHLLEALLELARRWRIPLRGHSHVHVLPSFYGRWNGESHPEQIGVPGLLGLLRSGVGAGVTELVCHPGYADGLASSYAGEREIELATLCDPRLREALAVHQISLIGFGDLARQQAERA